MSRYQSSLSLLHRALARARAPIDDHHRTNEGGSLMQSSHVASHQAADSATGKARSLTRPPPGEPPPDVAPVNPPMLKRVWRTVAFWDGHRAENAHK